jgi:hypothetical protein
MAPSGMHDRSDWCIATGKPLPVTTIDPEFPGTVLALTGVYSHTVWETLLVIL